MPSADDYALASRRMAAFLTLLEDACARLETLRSHVGRLTTQVLTDPFRGRPRCCPPSEEELRDPRQTALRQVLCSDNDGLWTALEDLKSRGRD